MEVYHTTVSYVIVIVSPKGFETNIHRNSCLTTRTAVHRYLFQYGMY